MDRDVVELSVIPKLVREVVTSLLNHTYYIIIGIIVMRIPKTFSYAIQSSFVSISLSKENGSIWVWLRS